MCIKSLGYIFLYMVSSLGQPGLGHLHFVLQYRAKDKAWTYLSIYLLNWISLCTPGCLGTLYVRHACLELRDIPDSAFQILGVKTCATMPGPHIIFLWNTLLPLLVLCVCVCNNDFNWTCLQKPGWVRGSLQDHEQLNSGSRLKKVSYLFLAMLSFWFFIKLFFYQRWTCVPWHIFKGQIIVCHINSFFLWHRSQGLS